MENTNDTMNDCGCGSDCCQPKKKNKWWRTLIIVLVIAAAGTIITIKLVGGSETVTPVTCDSTAKAQSPCCDTSGVKTCVKITNPGENPPCCPQSKP